MHFLALGWLTLTKFNLYSATIKGRAKKRKMEKQRHWQSANFADVTEKKQCQVQLLNIDGYSFLEARRKSFSDLDNSLKIVAEFFITISKD